MRAETSLELKINKKGQPRRIGLFSKQTLLTSDMLPIINILTENKSQGKKLTKIDKNLQN